MDKIALNLKTLSNTRIQFEEQILPNFFLQNTNAFSKNYNDLFLFTK